MDLFASADQRPVHFMGIGGAGMSALALLARRRGATVTGCDTDLSGAADLIAYGIPVESGHDPEHVLHARAVVVTAAVPPNHPELAAARARNIPVVPRKKALGALCAGRETVALSGTHGKTTTTVMTTEALAAAGLEPTGLAGGRVGAWGGNARVGADRVFVVEADEYDKAFLELEPTVAVVNNVEADHLECYGSVAALEDAFVEFASRADVALLGADDDGARRVAARLTRTRVVTFGVAEDAVARLTHIEQQPGRTSARVRIGHRDHTLVLRVPGLHNLRNATAALLAAHELGADLGAALDALQRFTGVGRRFDHVGASCGVEIVDDYAHHPTEVSATLEAARQAFPGRRLVAVFQPHLFSRTQQHGDALGAALGAADIAVVTEIYAAREQPVAGVSGRSVAAAAERAGTRALFVADKAALPDALAELVAEGDVVFTLGAGDITRVGPELLRRLESR
jgi:UDP-N-acetylmuramate--alanine ligase